jgi:hypothetical protein
MKLPSEVTVPVTDGGLIGNETTEGSGEDAFFDAQPWAQSLPEEEDWLWLLIPHTASPA